MHKLGAKLAFVRVPLCGQMYSLESVKPTFDFEETDVDISLSISLQRQPLLVGKVHGLCSILNWSHVIFFASHVQGQKKIKK